VFISTVHNLLPPATLATVRGILDKAKFVDGRISGGNDTNKNNRELPGDDKDYLEALRLVEGAVRDSMEFNFIAYPRYMTRPIFSRYDQGMYYKAHVDFPVNNFINVQAKPAHRGLAPVGLNYVRSDLSMTLFLSPPESYDGGQLSFTGTNEEQMNIKLPAGSGVVYPTGAEHSVLEVTRGSRLAAIFWIQSMFPAEAHRRLVYDAYQLHKSITEKHPESPDVALSERVYCNTFRLFAQV
jgi:PKHD-type hydroxylase